MVVAVLGGTLLISSTVGLVAASAAVTNTTGVASLITTVTANLNGSITTDSTYTATSIGFCYSTTQSSVATCSAGSILAAASPFTAPTTTTQAETGAVSGLAPGTTYYYNLMTTDSNSAVTYGATPLSFTTATPLTLTSTSGTYGSGLTLTSSGGGGTGAVTYTVTTAGTAGCTITSGVVSATSPGTCTVTVNQAADAHYVPSASAATTVTFAKAAATVSLGVSPVSPVAPGTSVTLTATVGAGETGTVAFQYSTDGTTFTAIGSCATQVVTGTTATCVTTALPTSTIDVNAIYSGDTNYLTQTSAAHPYAVVVSFASQAALVVTSTTGVSGTGLPLTTSGGSGAGAVSFVVTSAGTAGCSVTSGVLNATSPGTCVVTASKAGDTSFFPTSSSPTTVTFTLATQATFDVTSTNGTYGTSLTLTTSGGSGTGAVSYVVANGTATGCAISGSTLKATGAGTCVVTATKAADATYAATSSAATTVDFALPARPAAVVLRFTFNGTSLSVASQHELSALARKLVSGADIRLIGYAPKNGSLALARVHVVQRFLSTRAKVHVHVSLVTKDAVQRVTVETLSQ
ncbi:MAG TPA: hypothetical protein VGZ68_02370 [Acidimicrobiales bacterium]|jgi:hypothetical protein|nr:hypothetical protein [Acidimicrobiales bacterium]